MGSGLDFCPKRFHHRIAAPNHDSQQAVGDRAHTRSMPCRPSGRRDDETRDGPCASPIATGSARRGFLASCRRGRLPVGRTSAETNPDSTPAAPMRCGVRRTGAAQRRDGGRRFPSGLRALDVDLEQAGADAQLLETEALQATPDPLGDRVRQIRIEILSARSLQPGEQAPLVEIDGGTETTARPPLRRTRQASSRASPMSKKLDCKVRGKDADRTRCSPLRPFARPQRKAGRGRAAPARPRRAPCLRDRRRRVPGHPDGRTVFRARGRARR